MHDLTNPFAAAVTGTLAWLSLLHLAYVVSGLLMAAGYVGQIRKAWRQPQASLLALSMPSWLLWTACRVVALAYGLVVIRDAAFILVVSLDVTGRVALVLTLLRARHVQCRALGSENAAGSGATKRLPLAAALPLRNWAQTLRLRLRRAARHALVCVLLLPAFAAQAQPVETAALSAAQQATYTSARQFLKKGRYAEAYGRFSELAEQGHRASARMALVLYDLGPDLLGQAWSATPNQRRRWQTLAQQFEQSRTFGPDTEVRD